MPGRRFLIVSRDAEFSNSVRNGLSTLPGVDLIVNVGSQREAENKISRQVPMVILLDLDTVQVDAMLLKKMTDRFANVIPVLTAQRQFTAQSLIRGGITDFAEKPLVYSAAGVKKYLTSIINRIDGVSAQQTAVSYREVHKLVDPNSSQKVVIIAASTGGVEAIEKVLCHFGPDAPPILLVQHMPSGFTKLFAERLNGLFKFNIKEAQTGDFVMHGTMLIAPAGNHMKLVLKQGKLAVDCFLGARMHGVIPAADLLFESAAHILKKNTVGVILTGMGADGARGFMQIKNQGAKTIIQDEETCVVYGMPGAAKNLGVVDYELPIYQIANKIKSLL